MRAAALTKRRSSKTVLGGVWELALRRPGPADRCWRSSCRGRGVRNVSFSIPLESGVPRIGRRPQIGIVRPGNPDEALHRRGRYRRDRLSNIREEDRIGELSYAYRGVESRDRGPEAIRVVETCGELAAALGVVQGEGM